MGKLINYANLIKKKLILSAHDVADGGLFITLLESSMYNNLGFKINSLSNLRKDAFLFGESPSRVVVSVESNNKKQFEDFLSSTNTIFNQIGSVTSGNISVDNESYGDISEYKNNMHFQKMAKLYVFWLTGMEPYWVKKFHDFKHFHIPPNSNFS